MINRAFVLAFFALARCSSPSAPRAPTQPSTPVAPVPAEQPRAAKVSPLPPADLSPTVFPVEADDSSDDASAGPSPDTKDYGRDPSYKKPTPSPVVPTSTETAVMDELDRIARTFSGDLPRKSLLAELGTITTTLDNDEVSINPRSPNLAAIEARVDGATYEVIEVHLLAPIKVEVLMTRYRGFHNHRTDTRDDEFVDYDTDIFTSRRYRVSLAVRAGHVLPAKLAKESVSVVYLHRDRH